MDRVKDAVEELIEETYLLSLSDEELERDLTRFAEVCGWVIVKNVRDKRKLDILTQRLAMVRLLSLIANKMADLNLERGFRSEGRANPARERRIKSIVRNKRLILKTIEEYEPQLIPLIEEGLKAKPGKHRVSFWFRRWLNQRYYYFILKVGLILIGLAAMLLIFSIFK